MQNKNTLKCCPCLSSIIPQTLVHKQNWLRLSSLICNWILNILSNRAQTVRVQDIWSCAITLNTLGCTESFAKHTTPHNNVTIHHINHIIKFAAKTIVVTLFTNNNETAYREEVRQLEVWCKVNYVSFSSLQSACSKTIKIAQNFDSCTTNIKRGMRLSGSQKAFSQYMQG